MQSQDDGDIENTPLWWFRKLTSMLEFEVPAYKKCIIEKPCQIDFDSNLNENKWEETQDHSDDFHPLILCTHALNRARAPWPFIRQQNSRGDDLNKLIQMELGNEDGASAEEGWDVELVAKPIKIRQKDMIMEFDRISFWGFDVFRVASASRGWPLIHVAFVLFHSYDLFNRLGISASTFVNFMVHIEYGCNYSNNAFHNSLHVADMLQACHVLIYQLRLLGKLSDFDIFALFLAAIIHDYRHAGLTNQYLIASQDSVALLFNDVRLVENFACSAAFRLLASPEMGCDLLSCFETVVRQKIRQQVIALVFSTNVSDHFHFLGILFLSLFVKVESARTILITSKSPTSPLPSSYLDKAGNFLIQERSKCVTDIVEPPPLILTIDFLSKADPRADCLLKLIMKAADVSQSVRSWGLYSRWAQLIMEEYYLQGDIEKNDGMTVSKYMDRNQPQEALCHETYVREIVRPVFTLLCELVGISNFSLTPELKMEERTASPDLKKGTRENIDGGGLNMCVRKCLHNLDYALERWIEALSLEPTYPGDDSKRFGSAVHIPKSPIHIEP